MCISEWHAHVLAEPHPLPLPLPDASAARDSNAPSIDNRLVLLSVTVSSRISGNPGKGSSNGEGPVGRVCDDDDAPVGLGVTKGVRNGFFDMDFDLCMLFTVADGGVVGRGGTEGGSLELAT